MIRAAEQTTTATADAKLTAAEEKRDEAAGKYAQANMVEEAADMEKEKRQAEHADNG